MTPPVVLSNTGSITFIPDLRLETGPCTDMHRPWEVQTCQLKFGSWVHNGFEVNLMLSGQPSMATYPSVGATRVNTYV